MSFNTSRKRPRRALDERAPFGAITGAEDRANSDLPADEIDKTQSQRFNRELWVNFLKLAKPYWFSARRKSALILLAVLLLLLVAVNGLNVIINFVSGSFMTSLQEKNAPVFYKMLWTYFGIFVVGTPIVVFYSYMQDRLGMKWREWLTNHFMDKYFRNRKYYYVNNDRQIDNPDERMAQDVNAFCKSALSFTLVIIGAVITFCSFITILWQISTPLVAIVVGYAILGTLATYAIGRRLMGLNFNQLKKEANFRYGLIHVRNNTESIAFYQGEEQEKTQVKKRFSEAIWNFNMLIGWTRNLGFVTTGYNYMIVLIPALIIAPIYFAGRVKFGVFTQADMAFSQILSALSLVVSSFADLSNFAAVINRLSAFTEVLEESSKNTEVEIETIQVDHSEGIRLEGVTLMAANSQRILVKDLQLEVKPVSGLLIVGPSGSGKSSLLRALAGLWRSGCGKISRPDLKDIMFLPQRPYMILGSLRSQLLYPCNNSSISDAELNEVLAAVNLSGLNKRVGGFDSEINFADVLSLGEQQRLAFARLLLSKPRLAILDEATSALDLVNEEQLYKLLQATCTTVISVGHRPTLVDYHTSVLELKGDADWQLMSSIDYVEAKIRLAGQIGSLMKNIADSIPEADSSFADYSLLEPELAASHKVVETAPTI